TGGVVYYGKEFPDLDGAYLYGDYSTGKIWAMRVNEKHEATFHKETADTTANITCFAPNSRGELLITDSGGHRICKLARTPKEASHPEFPKTISASGLFKDVPTHTMADGIIPYSVNAELWSDGAYKERFIAIPAQANLPAPAGPTPTAGQGIAAAPQDDRRIGFTNMRGWEF